MFTKIGFVVIAYLIGSIPFSYLLGEWFKKEDIRKMGSGNLGTTNAYRVFGKLIGTTVLLLDTLKSGLLVLLMKYTGIFDGIELFHPLVYGLASVLGHVFPIWFKFHGGKGVASSFGLLLAYDPIMAAVILPIFLFVEFLTRYVSVASTVAALSALLFAVLSYFFIEPDIYFPVITFLAVSLIIWRHLSNYKRLMNCCENRVGIFDWYDRLKEKRKAKKHPSK